MKQLARDIMNTDVIAVRRGMDLRDLAKMFLDKAITGAPVVDERGELVGVVSQTDLVYYNLMRGDELVMDSHFYQQARMEGRHVPVGFQIEDFNSGSVRDVMTPVVHSVTETASLETVARLMTREHIHRVVVRKGRRPTGVISALDVIDAISAARRSTTKAASKTTTRRRAKATKKTRSAPARRRASSR